MRRFAVHVAIVVAAAMTADRVRADAGSVPAPPGPPVHQRTIRVSGEGRIRATPDLATVTIAVTAIDASLAKATRDAATAANRVADVLSKAGIAPSDLQTSRYDVQIERRADVPGAAPRIAGYRVSNALSVKIRDLSRVGVILDRVVAAGANEIEALAFVKEDTTAEESRALATAVKVARAKAEEIARAAGVRLGELLDVSEGARGPIPPPLHVRTMAMATAEVPVQPGVIEVTSRAEAVFAIP